MDVLIRRWGVRTVRRGVPWRGKGPVRSGRRREGRGTSGKAKHDLSCDDLPNLAPPRARAKKVSGTCEKDARGLSVERTISRAAYACMPSEMCWLEQLGTGRDDAPSITRSRDATGGPSSSGAHLRSTRRGAGATPPAATPIPTVTARFRFVGPPPFPAHVLATRTSDNCHLAKSQKRKSKVRRKPWRHARR